MWLLLWQQLSCDFGIGCAFLQTEVCLQWEQTLRARAPGSQEGFARVSGRVPSFRHGLFPHQAAYVWKEIYLCQMAAWPAKFLLETSGAPCHP